MKLLDYMRDAELDDEGLAARIGGCSGYAVKKWKYGERVPSIEVAARIEAATDGRVTLRDWVRPPALVSGSALPQVVSAHS